MIPLCDFGNGWVIQCDACNDSFAIDIRIASEKLAVFCPYCGKINKVESEYHGSYN